MLSFFFYSSGDPPALHSFPTRRSSDLRTQPEVWLAARYQRRCDGCKRNRAEGPLRKDRKSTRLNSSHPSISYAVFCLKKKKSKTEDRSTRCLERVGDAIASRRRPTRRH